MALKDGAVNSTIHVLRKSEWVGADPDLIEEVRSLGAIKKK